MRPKSPSLPGQDRPYPQLAQRKGRAQRKSVKRERKEDVATKEGDGRPEQGDAGAFGLFLLPRILSRVRAGKLGPDLYSEYRAFNLLRNRNSCTLTITLVM